MRKSLVVAALVLASCCIGRSQDKPADHVVIQGSPEQIKKAAVVIFARDGFSLESKTASQLKMSKPLSAEETAAYNTAHWTNEPVANCRHVHILSWSPSDGAVAVAVESEMACNPSAGKSLYFRTSHEKESEWMQSTLDALKASVEEANRRR